MVVADRELAAERALGAVEQPVLDKHAGDVRADGDDLADGGEPIGAFNAQGLQRLSSAQALDEMTQTAVEDGLYETTSDDYSAALKDASRTTRDAQIEK